MERIHDLQDSAPWNPWGQNRKEVLPGGFCLLDFFYQASKPEPPRFPVWQIQSRYPGKNLRKDVSPNSFYSPEKKTLSRKVAVGIRFGIGQFKQLIGIRFMFGRTTDLNHFQTIGTLEHLMPDVRWLEHTVPWIHDEWRTLILLHNFDPTLITENHLKVDFVVMEIIRYDKLTLNLDHLMGAGL